MENIAQHIEALIFTAEQSISSQEIAGCLSAVFNVEISSNEVEHEISELKVKYQSPDYFYELAFINNGYIFLTKKEFANTLNTLVQQRNRKKLSTAAMETLAIIAYKQPITKPELEQIRGVNCDYSIQKLLDKELITIIGKSDAPGKPILYGTSALFMDYFNLNSINDLPQLSDIQPIENEIGSTNDI